VITALRHWGARHYQDAALTHTECGHAIELHAYCPNCARDVAPAELTVAP
jgi:hypothetical protein